MKLYKDELIKIQTILDKFPDVTNFELVRDTRSGIGYILSIKFDYIVNDVNTTLEVEITGVENW